VTIQSIVDVGVIPTVFIAMEV